MLKGKRTTRITAFFAALVTVLSVLAFPLSVAGLGGTDDGLSGGIPDGAITVSVTGLNGEKEILATANSANYVITLSEPVPEDAEVTVYYRTRNESALSDYTDELGVARHDYTSVDEKITFLAGEQTARRSIRTWQDYRNAISYEGTAVEGISGLRSFEISIYKVESKNCDAVKSEDHWRARVCVASTVTFTVTSIADMAAEKKNVPGYVEGSKITDSYGNQLSFDNQLFFTSFIEADASFKLYEDKFPFINWWTESEEHSETDNFTLNWLAGMPDAYGNPYVHAYMGFSAVATETQLSVGSCEDDNYVTLYAKDKNENWVMVERLHSDYADSSTHWVSAADMKGVFLRTKSTNKWVRSLTSSTSIYTDKSSYFVFDENTVLMRAPSSKGKVEVENACWMDTKQFDVQFRQVVVDDVAPTVYSYTYDNVQLTGDDTARISVRFNEAVQLMQDKKAVLPTLHVRTTTATPRDLYFTYAGGAGTDTLWFEYKLSDYTYGDSVKFIKPVEIIGDICDFSLNRAELANGSYGWTFGANLMDPEGSEPATDIKFPFDYDFRKPDLTVRNSEASLVKPSLQKTVSLELTNGDLADIRYAWSRERTDKEYFLDYTNTTTFENTQIANQRHPIPSPVGLTGVYYLYVEAISPLLVSRKFRFGPYVFDNRAPAVSEITMAEDTLKTKTFSFTARDDTFTAAEEGLAFTLDVTDISFVYYEGRVKRVKPEFTDEIKIVENGTVKLGGAIFDTSTADAVVQFTLTSEDFGLDEGESGYYFAVIRVKDELGNVYESAQKQYRFDTRNLFYTEISVTEGESVAVTAYGEKVFNTKNTGVTVKAALTAESADDAGGTWSVSSILRNGEDASGDDWYSFDPANAVLTFAPTAPVGRVEVVFGLTKDGTEKISDTYVFYFVTGEEHTENEQNLSGNLLLTNKVYQLNTPYYYLEKGGEGAVFQRKETYGNAKGKPTFSSKEEAFRYVYYNELQSMYIECISANAAAQLNSQTGDTNYSKALTEKTTAKEGQLWIRYKRANWIEPSSLTDLNGWCYYYYGEAGTSDYIKEAEFSSVLSEALASVTTYIVSQGETTWLFGVPTLDASQIHVAVESFNKTKAGSNMFAPVVYYGDDVLYHDTVIANGEEIWLVTNYAIKVSENTRFFIASAYDGIVSSSYKEYAIDSGTTFAELQSENGDRLVTGIYAVREIDENGMSEYFVYIDKTEPFAQIDLTSKAPDGTVTRTTLLTNRTESNGHVYSARSAMIVAIGESELDTYAYICVKKFRTGEILNVYHGKDLSDGVELADGYYQIEVCDRSGNLYSFSLRVSNDDLACRIVNDGTKFSVFCDNRSGDQIDQYVIRRNGEDLHVSFTEKYSDTRSGYYEIYIEDIFGNVFERTFDFSRQLPSVTWYYLPDGASKPVPYSEDCKEMMIQAVSDFTNLISTARPLSFSFSENYGYTVENGEVAEKFDPYSGLTTVSLTPTGDMRVTIYYKDTPDVSIVYFCSFDNVAPRIEVSYMATTYRTEDFDGCDVSLGNVGDPVIPERISFAANVATEKAVHSGDTVSAMILSVSVFDDSGADYAEVYLNGALVATYTRTGGSLKDFTLGKYGEYKIVAYDVFGNKSTFTFTNRKQADTRYFIDGKEVAYLPGVTFTDGVCDRVEYGGTEQTVVIAKDNEIAVIIEVGGQSYFYAYVLENGSLYPRFYSVGARENLDTHESVKQIDRHLGDCLLSATDTGVRTIVSEETFTVVAWFAEGVLYLKTTCDTQGELTVATRVMNSTFEEPFFARTVLSNRYPTAAFKVGENGTAVTPADSHEDGHHFTLKVNDNFTISFDKLAEEKIKSIKIGYSTTSLIENAFEILDAEGLKSLWRLSGDTEIGEEAFDLLTDERKLYHATAANGYYEITVENIYGNKVIYTAVRADGFMVNTVVTYQDAQKTYYDFNYGEKIFSNGQIEYTVFYNGAAEDGTPSGSFRFVLEKDGEKLGEGTLNNGSALTVEYDGEYVLKIFDEYGNAKELYAQINKTDLTVAGDVVCGFNEKALLKEYGYTNGFLSVNAEAVLREGYHFVSVAKTGEVPVVLYDRISQNRKALNAEELVNCIGKDGDGEYEIVFRDKFGNKLVFTANIRFTPTLSVARVTRNSVTPEACDLALVCERGVAANDSLIFATAATVFEFKLDGKLYPITQPLTFRSATEEATYVYTVDYVDEYGFCYTFTAKLYRGTPLLELDANARTTVIAGDKYTKDRLSYRVDEQDAVCVYYKDDAVVGIPYHSGTELLQDGKYLFEVTDSAGNVNFDTVVKDTVCDYEFIETHTEATVVKGAITNESRVKFASLGDDDVKIVKVLLDGKEVESFDKDNITENGKWEFILCDRLGNVDYYAFTQVSHALSALEYTSSDGFVITEAWFTGTDGGKINYLSYVENVSDVQSYFRLANDGTYDFKMANVYTRQVLSFRVVIDNVVPDVTLVGCEEGETTINNVTLKGVKDGDTIDIYKDGVLTESVVYRSGGTLPVISEGGEYTVVVTSVSGIPKTMTFERKHIANTAGSVMIIIVVVMIFTALMIGLICRTKLKTDE